jgi:phosphatidylserine synthase
MPEPITKYASDNIIYSLTKKISPYICFIHPNIISFIGFLFVIPILHNYKYNRSVKELILLAFIRQFFDCLDGTVARSCNTGSIFGAKLDIFLDLLTSIVVSIYILYNIIYRPPKEKYKIIISIIMIISVTYYLGKYMYDKLQADKNKTNIDDIEFDNWFRFCHDNSMIVVIVIFILIKKIIN